MSVAEGSTSPTDARRPASRRVARRKLAVVISHPIQHFAPLFRDLAKQPELELRVFYCCDWGISQYADPGWKDVSVGYPIARRL